MENHGFKISKPNGLVNERSLAKFDVAGTRPSDYHNCSSTDGSRFTCTVSNYTSSRLQKVLYILNDSVNKEPENRNRK